MVNKLSFLASIVAVALLHTWPADVLASSLRSKNSVGSAYTRSHATANTRMLAPGSSCQSGTNPNCVVNCELATTLNNTSAQCNQTTGFVSKYYNVKTPPRNGGTQCNLVLQPTNETCTVNCELDTTFNETGAKCNSTTGLLSKFLNVKTPPRNGGTQCNLTRLPTTETCPVKCVFVKKNEDMTPYDNICVEAANGQWYESRIRAIAVEAKNGGECVPIIDTKKCKPVACVRDGPTDHVDTNPFVAMGEYRGRYMSRVPGIKTPALYGGACPANVQKRPCSVKEFWDALKNDSKLFGKYVTSSSTTVQVTETQQSGRINFLVTGGQVAATLVSAAGVTTDNFGNNGVVAVDEARTTIKFTGTQACASNPKQLKALVITIKCGAKEWKFDRTATKSGNSCTWNMDMWLPGVC